MSNLFSLLFSSSLPPCMFSPLFFFVSFFSSELSKGGRRWKIRENMVRDILSLFYITATRRRLREQRKGRERKRMRE